MNKKLIELIKANFENKLKAKTGWGRNEIIILFDQAVNESLLQILDEKV